MDDLNQAYAETVQAVAGSVTDVMDGEWGERDWRRLVVNHESLLHTAEPEASTIAFAVATKPGGEPEIVDFRISRAAKNGFKRIADIMHAQKGQYWTVCDLTVERDGSYRFDFSYDPPYRLGGHLHDTRFDDYLQRYLAETGAR
ncbi:hypothetical protein [Dokdonella ginsengisoli]|uniref:SRPBCC family protein n=1 Tax=Dokdonella ginsengisoli TaxID=363846 RepID=A0ABV9QRC2_9GAMM